MIRLIATRLMYLAIAAHRIWAPLGSFVKAVNHILTGADISAAASIDIGLRLFHPTGVVIGPKVRIGSGVTIQQGVTLGHGRGGSPVISDAVHLGPGAVIVGKYTVGSGSIVGANAVVTGDIPPGQIWAGVPARFVRQV